MPPHPKAQLTSLEAEQFLQATRKREDALYAPMMLDMGSFDIRTCKLFMECRRDMAIWLIDTADVLGFEPATAETAQRLLDRISIIDRDLIEDFELYQVSCLACLTIACKMFQTKDTFRKKERLQLLSQGIFSQEEIDHMELHVLYSLGWRVQPPTAIKIAESILQTIPLDSSELSLSSRDKVTTDVNALIQQSMIDPRFLPFRASSVAKTAVLCSLQPILPATQFQTLHEYFEGPFEHDEKSFSEDLEQLICLFRQLTPEARGSINNEVPESCGSRLHSNPFGIAKQPRSPSSSPRCVVSSKRLQKRVS